MNGRMCGSSGLDQDSNSEELRLLAEIVNDNEGVCSECHVQKTEIKYSGYDDECFFCQGSSSLTNARIKLRNYKEKLSKDVKK